MFTFRRTFPFLDLLKLKINIASKFSAELCTFYLDFSDIQCWWLTMVGTVQHQQKQIATVKQTQIRIWNVWASSDFLIIKSIAYVLSWLVISISYRRLRSMKHSFTSQSIAGACLFFIWWIFGSQPIDWAWSLDFIWRAFWGKKNHNKVQTIFKRLSLWSMLCVWKGKGILVISTWMIQFVIWITLWKRHFARDKMSYSAIRFISQ